MLQDEMAKLVVSAQDLHGMSQDKGRENQGDWFEPRTLELSLSGGVAGACKHGIDSLHKVTVSKSF
jgi:hypothetical protein